MDLLTTTDIQPQGQLSTSHFLAPRTICLAASPFEPPPSTQVSHLGTGQDGTTPIDTATLASADFDVDVKSGFLSPSAPLKRLTHARFNAWESALDEIQNIISAMMQDDDQKNSSKSYEGQVKNWKQKIVSNIEIIGIDSLLTDIIELRRAHLVLAFLTHAYVHSDALVLKLSSPEHGAIVVPASLAVPFCQISHALDIPPVLTYADSVLYNWHFKNSDIGFTSSNVEITTTFTRTESERHFYKTSVLVEALGPECLKLMRSSLDEAFMGDSISIKRIVINLEKLSKQIDSIARVLGQVRAGCDPKTFYWDIRPWFNAGKWTWEGVESSDTSEGTEWRVTELGGPSAGQSTLIHAMDVFLGIDHQPNRQEIENGIRDEETFMNRMSTYMPHHHRLFLKHLSQSCLTDNDESKQSNLIRSIVLENHSNHPNLKKNYNQCIKALENLRATHTRIVSLFIISQKNSKNQLGSTTELKHQSFSTNQNLCTNVEEKEKKNYLKSEENVVLDIIDSQVKHDYKLKNDIEKFNNQKHFKNHVLKGTGGTDLSKFLKRCKLRTCNALILDDN